MTQMAKEIAGPNHTIIGHQTDTSELKQQTLDAVRSLSNIIEELSLNLQEHQRTVANFTQQGKVTTRSLDGYQHQRNPQLQMASHH